MVPIEWSTENEIQLFYAMMNHKPVGINKHFQMVAIHNKFTSSLNCELNADEIWKKLDTYYDLQALDESDKLPFPNNEEEFTLPEESFASLIEERLQKSLMESDDEPKPRQKPPTRKDDAKEEASSKREKAKEQNDHEDEDKETPRRSLKRNRESSSANKSASSKRRR